MTVEIVEKKMLKEKLEDGGGDSNIHVGLPWFHNCLNAIMYVPTCSQHRITDCSHV